MSHTVVFTTGARQDLLKIYRYIKAAGSPEAARRLHDTLASACQTLSENPERGHIPQELEGLSILFCRQIVVKNHRIIYQIMGETTVIHGIIDGRRDIRETLRQRFLF